MEVEYLPGDSTSSGDGSGGYVLIKFKHLHFKLTYQQFSIMMTTCKTWNSPTSDCKFPFYRHNLKNITLFQCLYKLKPDELIIEYKNGDCTDLRYGNINIYHMYHTKITDEYKVLEYKQGHYSSLGKEAYCLKNPIWKVIDKTTEDISEYYYVMYCELDKIVKFDELAFEQIYNFIMTHNSGSNITWFQMKNGYIGGHIRINGKDTVLYMHQVIMNYFGNGKGTSSESIDHIDRDVLNNRSSNLRIVTTEVQQSNQKHVVEKVKKTRQKTARPLPDGITQDMLPKYVNYYIEHYGKDKACSREFFRIESHPMLEKDWATTKSGKVSLLAKLQQAKDKLVELDIALSCVVDGESETEPETESAMTSTPTTTSTPPLTDIIEGVNMVLMSSTASSTPIS